MGLCCNGCIRQYDAWQSASTLLIRPNSLPKPSDNLQEPSLPTDKFLPSPLIKVSRSDDWSFTLIYNGSWNVPNFATFKNCISNSVHCCDCNIKVIKIQVENIPVIILCFSTAFLKLLYHTIYLYIYVKLLPK